MSQSKNESAEEKWFTTIQRPDRWQDDMSPLLLRYATDYGKGIVVDFEYSTSDIYSLLALSFECPDTNADCERINSRLSRLESKLGTDIVKRVRHDLSPYEQVQFNDLLSLRAFVITTAARIEKVQMSLEADSDPLDIEARADQNELKTTAGACLNILRTVDPLLDRLLGFHRLGTVPAIALRDVGPRHAGTRSPPSPRLPK